MSHQDAHVQDARTNSAYLLAALQWVLSGIDWSPFRFRHDCTWTPRGLVCAALLWVWSDEATLIERLLCATRLVRHFEELESKKRNVVRMRSIKARLIKRLRSCCVAGRRSCSTCCYRLCGSGCRLCHSGRCAVGWCLALMAVVCTCR